MLFKADMDGPPKKKAVGVWGAKAAQFDQYFRVALDVACAKDSKKEIGAFDTRFILEKKIPD